MFADLADVFDPDLRLPINGKTYVIPPPSAAVGLRLEALQALVNAAKSGARLSEREVKALRLDDEQELNLYQSTLGPAYDQMVADGVSFPALKRAGMTAYLFWTQGEESAERYWASGSGKAPSGTTSTPTGEASSTPTPASGSGTSSPSTSPEGSTAAE